MCWFLRENYILVQILVCGLAVVCLKQAPADILVQRSLYLRLETKDACARTFGHNEQIWKSSCYASYSAAFEKGYTSVHGGCISSQCCLRSTQWLPGRSMGVVNSGNAPGLNFRPSACGPSVRGRRTAPFGGITWESRAAHGEPPQTQLGPWPPQSPGPLGHPPAIPIPGLALSWGMEFLLVTLCYKTVRPLAHYPRAQN